jgi:uncharacterized protein (TIGR02444 family)
MEQKEDGVAQNQDTPENPFWDFTLVVYGRPGVKDACLALQDDAGLDVNLVLFCCWTAQEGKGRLTRAEIQSAMAVVAVWRVQVLQPLRRVRRRLSKTGPRDESRLREALLKVELGAEQIEQRRLYAGLIQESVAPGNPLDRRQSDARYNCDIYLDEMGVALDDALVPALDTIIDAATRD